ncbi:MAG TPA: hypothetical protein VL069_13110 [Opitutus sp.]|nr:hypothetical protein [Opitutus sp.]
MNIKISLPAVLAALALFVAAPAFSQHAQGKPHTAGKQADAQTGKLIEVTEKEAAWAAEAAKTYPLDVCVVSDEKLGSMGDAAKYIYRVEGQPDRLVMFCCGGCEEDFLKAPAQHLAKLDAAKKSKSK